MSKKSQNESPGAQGTQPKARKPPLSKEIAKEAEYRYVVMGHDLKRIAHDLEADLIQIYKLSTKKQFRIKRDRRERRILKKAVVKNRESYSNIVGLAGKTIEKWLIQTSKKVDEGLSNAQVRLISDVAKNFQKIAQDALAVGDGKPQDDVPADENAAREALESLKSGDPMFDDKAH